VPTVAAPRGSATAFQLAGFRHVIGSLWPLSDGVALKAAMKFYHRLPATAPADSSSQALHGTTLELRAAAPDRPDLWAPLIHYGP
jgi:CHAT domain-containing protein